MHSLLYEILSETFDDFRQRASILINNIEECALLDELTSCLNRNAFEQRIKMLEARKHLLPIGVMFIDLNGLHQINELNGHKAGDVIWRDMGRMLKAYWGSIDTYRVGGDEFVVFQTQTNKEDFLSKVKEFKKAMKLTHTFTISIGCCVADEKISINDAITSADEIMMEEKKIFHQNNKR